MKKYLRVCVSLDQNTDRLLNLLSSSCNMSKSVFIRNLIEGKLQVKAYINGNVLHYDIYENFRYSERYNLFGMSQEQR